MSEPSQLPNDFKFRNHQNYIDYKTELLEQWNKSLTKCEYSFHEECSGEVKERTNQFSFAEDLEINQELICDSHFEKLNELYDEQLEEYINNLFF